MDPGSCIHSCVDGSLLDTWRHFTPLSLQGILLSPLFSCNTGAVCAAIWVCRQSSTLPADEGHQVLVWTMSSVRRQQVWHTLELIRTIHHDQECTQTAGVTEDGADETDDGLSSSGLRMRKAVCC